MGLIDWLLLALIAVAAFFALRRMRKNKGSCSYGGSCAGCGGDCGACGQSCTCGKAGKTPENKSSG